MTSDPKHCALDAAIADLDGLGLSGPRLAFLKHLIIATHNDGYWEGVEAMATARGVDGDASDGADGDDTGGIEPDPKAPTGPGLPGGDSGLGRGCVGDDRDNTAGHVPGWVYVDTSDKVAIS